MSKLRSESWISLIEHSLKSGEPLIGSIGEDGRWMDSITGEDIAKVLRKEGRESHPHGLDLYGFRISGQLDLSSLKLGFGVTLRSCTFEQEIRVTKAELVFVDLVGSTFPGLNLDGSRILGGLDLSLATCTETLSATQAEIIGTFFGHKLTVVSSRRFSLLLNGTKFGSDVVLPQSKFVGGIRFRGCQLKGSLDVRDTHVRANDSLALDLDHASINHVLDLRRLEASGTISLRRLNLDGDLEGEYLEVLATTGSAIDATSATITGSCDLEGLKAKGPIYFDGLSVSGDLFMRRGTVRSPSTTEPALSMFNATVKGDVFFSESEIVGTLRAAGAIFDSNFVILNSDLRVQEGHAVYLNRAKVAGHTKLLDCRISGIVAFQGATFGGEVNFSDSKFAGSTVEINLDLFSASCAYSVVLDRTTIHGGLELGECTVGTFIAMNDCRILAWHTQAISARNLKVKTEIFIADAAIDGLIDLSSISVSGELSLTRVILTGSDPRLLLDDSQLGTLVLADAGTPFTGISLNKARIESLLIETSKEHLPQLLGARDVHIGALGGTLTDNQRDLHDWLLTLHKLAPAGIDQKHKSAASQPWHEVARALQNAGRSEESRWFHIKAAEQASYKASLAGRSVRLVYGALAGYGYRPWYVLIWLLLLWCFALALITAFGDAFYPTDPTIALFIKVQLAHESPTFDSIQDAAISAGYTPLNRYLYALEAVIPTPQVGQAAAWRPSAASPLSLMLSLLRSTSWLLSALLLASVTGLLRKI